MAYTYFFRDLQTLEIAAENLIATAMGRKFIRIWDAGCAMGPEPYTLAIVLAEKMNNVAFRNVHIDATDIDEGNLFEEIITNGVYSEEELGRIPSEIFNEYFLPDCRPGYFRLIDKIRKRVFFQKHDLLSFQAIGDNYSMIICKNVLLHFNQKERIEVIRMFHKALGEKGFLVMEQTQKLTPDFEGLFEQSNSNAQVFQKV